MFALTNWKWGFVSCRLSMVEQWMQPHQSHQHKSIANGAEIWCPKKVSTQSLKTINQSLCKTRTKWKLFPSKSMSRREPTATGRDFKLQLPLLIRCVCNFLWPVFKSAWIQMYILIDLDQIKCYYSSETIYRIKCVAIMKFIDHADIAIAILT